MSKFLAAARGWITSTLALALMVSMIGPAFAAGGQLGNLNGYFVDATTKAPLANVAISVVSPASRYTAKTDAKGFFQINGVTVDTYTVTAEYAGYETTVLTGVTVQGDQTISLGTQAISKKLQTIGRVTGRSVTSAFQPTQTVDQTTLSGTRALIAQGKKGSTDEASLALSVPGVQLDNAGALTIRGGLKSDVGYQIDGIPITEPFLGGNGTNGFYNGLGSLQVVAGQGDASQGNVGTGVINIIPKRGAYPGFGLLDLEVGGPNFFHQAGADYGIASPNGRFSDYLAFNAQRFVPQLYGYRGTDAANYGNIDGISYAKNDDVLNNFIYKFGKNNNQSIKLLTDIRNYQTYGDLSGLAGRVPFTSNPYFYSSFGASDADPINNQAFLSSVLLPLPYQPTGSGPPTQADLNGYNPTRLFELEYDNSLNASTFLSVKSYNFNQLQGGTNYYASSTAGFGAGQYSVTGGSRAGVKLELTKTLNDSNTLTFGGEVQNQHPIWDGVFSGLSGFLNSLFYQFGLAGAAPSLADYAVPANSGPVSGANPCPVANGCYLYTALGNVAPGKIASFGINYNKTDLQIFSIYLRDQIQLGKKLNLDLGLREDRENWKQGANPYSLSLSNPDDVPVGGNAVVGVDDNYLRDAVVHPKILQPRAAANYKIDQNDTLGASFGVSTIFANAQTLGTPAALYGAGKLNSIAPLPGTNTADPATWTCGSGYNAQYLQPGGANAAGSGGAFFRCTSYAQQLYWNYDQNFDAPDAGNNIPPTQVDKDITYQHLFHNGTGLRFTAYYDRGYSLPELNIISQILNSQGVPISQVFGVTNLGTNKTSGAEIGLTTRERAVGFTGFLSATYTNVLNTVPPLVAGEDVLPLVPVASIKLGNLYRAGYVSPFTVRAGGQYKFKNGFRINPVLSYDRGFPTGVGNIIATQYPGGFANLPQTNINAPTYSGFGGISGAFNATNYVDPTNPGTIGSPNIAATRGTPETSAAGGILTRPRLNANISFEYTHNRNTFGVQLQNLFGNVFSEPIYNPYVQPVANGVVGPQTGTTQPATPGSNTFVYGGFRNIPYDAYGNSPYIELPTRPMTVRVYYQLGL